jgi:DNA-binding XRE family transcriptional regulator
MSEELSRRGAPAGQARKPRGGAKVFVDPRGDPPEIDPASIKELRRRMGGLTQEDFGVVVRMSKQHVSKLEQGKIKLTGSTQVLILWLLSVHELGGRTPHPSIPLVILPQ